jgi:uncharacterized membrane protein
MELLNLVMILIVAFIMLEVSKHIMVKTFAKSIIAVLIISAAFLFIIGTISSENEIKTENQVIQTGATIVEQIKEINFVENSIEKITEFIKDFGK